MRTINIHRPKLSFQSSLIRLQKVSPYYREGGRPLVRGTALGAPTSREKRRLGFMGGQITVPEDFDRMGSEEIEQLFGSG